MKTIPFRRTCTQSPTGEASPVSSFDRKVVIAAASIFFAASGALVWADSGNLINNLTTAATACPGFVNAVYADVDGNGSQETLAVFQTIEGEAYGDPWGYFFSGIDSHCGGSSPWHRGKIAAWFVDTTKPGFVVSNPSTWTYKSVGGVRLSINSDFCISQGTWNTAYRSVDAYTERFRGGTLINSYLYKAVDPDPDIQTCEFNSGSGLMEVYLTTDFCENVIMSFIILSGTASPAISVGATDPLAGEPGSMEGSGTFTFHRTGPTTAPLTVNFSVGGTATAGSDYTALGTSVAFASGSATATKLVIVGDDTDVEGDETVVLTLAGGTGYVVGTPASATITIKDDEPPSTTILSCSGIPGGDDLYCGFYVSSTQV